MENKKPTTGKFGLIYGVIASVIGIIFTFMLIAGDMLYDPSPIKSIVQILIFVLVVIVAIFNFKKANNGYLSLGQALGIGAITALVASIISIIFMYLLSSVIVPDFWEKTAEISRITIQEQNPSLTADQVENAIEMQNKFSWIMYPAILIMNLFIGFVTALITGLILKKTENLD
tara:strand:- start:129581 stop:130102 length:522 start_codon:yes stop_codon:yes gene_type:complete